MKERLFRNFKLLVNIEEQVSSDNFFKFHFYVKSLDDRLLAIISSGELSLDIAKALSEGNEDEVKNALNTVIINRQFWLENLKSIVTKF